MEEKDINQIIERKNSQEKRLRLRSVAIISMIFLGGLLWLLWTNSQVNYMNKRVLELNDTIQQKEEHIQKLQEDLSRLNDYLHKADNFKTHKVGISPEDRKQYLYTDQIDQQLRLVFKEIIEFQDQGIEFNVRGSSPEEGFNSPSFITYVLSKHGITESIELSSSSLISNFERVSDSYKPGDLIIYKSGYSMIYFENNYTNTSPFVFGMTPSGILALKPDFAQKAAHLRPRYN